MSHMTKSETLKGTIVTISVLTIPQLIAGWFIFKAPQVLSISQVLLSWGFIGTNILCMLYGIYTFMVSKNDNNRLLYGFLHFGLASLVALILANVIYYQGFSNGSEIEMSNFGKFSTWITVINVIPFVCLSFFLRRSSKLHSVLTSSDPKMTFRAVLFALGYVAVVILGTLILGNYLFQYQDQARDSLKVLIVSLLTGSVAMMCSLFVRRINI